MRLTPYYMASLVKEIVSPVEPQVIDPELFSRLNLQSQYAAAAYCDSAANGPDSKIQCLANNCPLVQAANVRSISAINHHKHGDTNGFVGVDHTNKQIVVAFRGTQSNSNIIADAKFREHDVPSVCQDCKVHSGFHTAWNMTSPMVYESLSTAMKQYPDMDVTVTGHSLGGAIATIAAASLRSRGVKLTLYTFGSPRVGNAQFTSYLMRSGKNYRVTHADDPVPFVPPSAMGYAQPYPEIHIMDKPLPVSIERMEMIGEQPSRRKLFLSDAKRIARLDFPAHKLYFGNITACGPGLDKGLFVLVGLTAAAAAGAEVRHRGSKAHGKDGKAKSTSGSSSRLLRFIEQS